MKLSKIGEDVFSRLLRTAGPKAQAAIRQEAGGLDHDPAGLLRTYLSHPFLRLTPEELSAVGAVAAHPMLVDLVAVREWAAQTRSPRHGVFCMPKSGSSFVQSSIQHALQVPFVSLTGFGANGVNSWFGMNPREQELDELAMIKAILCSPQGFVAQHHTRGSLFLALQLQAFGIRPIVTVRNIPDALVSFDEMIRGWRAHAGRLAWSGDAWCPLPLDYQARPAAERLDLLARGLGVWLVNFHLSWRRVIDAGHAAPLVLRYEQILDQDSYVRVLAEHLELNAEQTSRLAQYARHPDPKASRLNRGRSGRGREAVPAESQAFLRAYADTFGEEISLADRDYLLPA